MDLVEIRKRAKEVKKKSQLKESSSDELNGTSFSDEKKNEVADETVSGQPIPVGDELGYQEFSETKLCEEKLIPGGNSDDSYSTSKEEPLDFLSIAINTLYHQGMQYSDEDGHEDDDDGEKLDYLCFMLSNEEYALDLRHLREIVKMVNVTEVPRTPNYVLGIISLRGNVIPLFDLRMRLGLEISEESMQVRIIIVSHDGANMGLVVDSVTEVVSMNSSALEPPPTVLTNIKADLLEGVGRCDDRLLIIPDLSAVLTLN